MLSFMVLLVLILILAQIKYSTDTTGRVGRNEETLVSMDSAIESCLLQVFEDLKSDAEASGAGSGLEGGGAGAGADGAASGGAASGGAAPGGQTADPTDSKEDEWARAQRTELNEIQVRILIQDEDSKFNLLSVLTADEDEAEKALDRLSRVIEWSRKGTKAEIDGSTARRMATTMLEYLRRRSSQVLPRPELLSDVEEDEELGLPLSLREFVALDPELFTPDLFRDFLDEDERVVHSLGSFLTVWSSVGTLDDARQQAAEPGGGAQPQDPESEDPSQDASQDPSQGEPDPSQGPVQDPTQGAQDPTQDPTQDPSQGSVAGSEGSGATGQGGGSPPPGWAINVNTAPGAVLHALMEDRDLPYRFWDDVVLYRNEKDETVEENEDPPLDEYGQPIIVRQFFRTVADLANVDGWESIEPLVQAEITGLLKTRSQVFSIFVTARKPTGEERIEPYSRREDIEREEAVWQGLVRTVRAVVWRREVSEGEAEIVPIVRWEVLDYVPFEVLDFPEARDYR
jgi:hypothetical protein